MKRTLLVLFIILAMAACTPKIAITNPDPDPVNQEIEALTETLNLTDPTETEISNSVVHTPQDSTERSPSIYSFNPNLCQDTSCILDQLHLFKRPINPGLVNWIDKTYPFGSTGGEQYPIHHGVEFMNPSGTDVLAVGAGIVVIAGDDLKVNYAEYKNFYGNLVIIQHDVDEITEPIYSLYGHLSKINVESGQKVSEGQVIGSVGATGSAIGSHLHFELRIGVLDYGHNVNPILWVVPRVTEKEGLLGNLAGIVTDRWGNPLLFKEITLDALQKNAQGRFMRYFIVTYGDETMTGVSPYHENFSYSDLPAGDYRLSMVNGKLIERTITIYPGQTSFVTIRIP
ncbi:MAG: M23 family metallopeptidase [Anaerolineaceae bacterium]|nr:M23 family metallopeptidase [Anaerolineaceae bacterium]